MYTRPVYAEILEFLARGSRSRNRVIAAVRVPLPAAGVKLNRRKVTRSVTSPTSASSVLPTEFVVYNETI